ncbi:MAG: hypothetical protein JXM71_02780 [Spirochaetales bacterium]|nr:hypothetical protein [Spirochaetales bacterium]
MIRFFFPDAERASLPLSLSRRVPILVGTDVLLILYFLLASVTRYLGDPEGSLAFVVAVGSTETLFVASLALVRGGRYRAASFISTLGVLLNVLWLGALLPIESASDIYRFATYVIASGVSNYLISMDRRQVLVYSIASTLAFVVILFALYVPILSQTQGDQVRVIATTVMMLMVSVDICLVIMERLANTLLAAAERGQEEQRARAGALAAIVEGSARNLGIGDELVRVAADAAEAGRQARVELEAIRADTERLASGVREVDRANLDVSAKAEAMKGDSSAQSAFLADTALVIKDMLATVRELSGYAGQRQALLQQAIQGLAFQLDKARLVAAGMGTVSAASRNVSEVASGIADVAEKTNLLAMNASIEAAHAGAMGKGFGVIAQEIRALSAVARGNTQEIGAVLSRSDAAINASVGSVEEFVRELESLTKSVVDAFEGMAETVQGLTRVDADASSVRGKLDEMVETAHSVSEGAATVAATISGSTGTLRSAASLSEALKASAGHSVGSFVSIERALDTVSEVGRKNRDEVAKLESSLRAADAETP